MVKGREELVEGYPGICPSALVRFLSRNLGSWKGIKWTGQCSLSGGGTFLLGLWLGNQEESKQKDWRHVILNKTRFAYYSDPYL